MAKLQIYSDIVSSEEKVFLSDWGLDGVCFKDIADFIGSIAEDDPDIDIRINCRGGSVVEGWAIYDALRHSGKNISATIEGECSSMATIILLAAPLERRKSYENAHICIHNPAVEWIDTDCYSRLTADNLDKVTADVAKQAEALRAEQEKIVNLYVERTGADRATLQAIMDKDTYIDTKKAVELGFIASIVPPTTAKRTRIINSNFKTMAKKDETVEVKQSLFKRLLAMVGLSSLDDMKIIDQVVTAADGREFTVERENGDPQVGDTAYPDGSYVLDDGTTIVIEGEVITNIIPEGEAPAPQEPEPQEKSETTDECEGAPAPAEGEPATAGDGDEGGEDAPDPMETIEQLQEQVATLQQRVKELEQENEELRTQVSEQSQALNDAKLTDEQTQILDKVTSAGGLDWLESVMSMKSTFHAQNRRFVDHSVGNQAPAGESKTQRAIREQRERAEAKRNRK